RTVIAPKSSLTPWSRPGGMSSTRKMPRCARRCTASARRKRLPLACEKKSSTAPANTVMAAAKPTREAGTCERWWWWSCGGCGPKTTSYMTPAPGALCSIARRGSVPSARRSGAARGSLPSQAERLDHHPEDLGVVHEAVHAFGTRTDGIEHHVVHGVHPALGSSGQVAFEEGGSPA